MFYFQAEDGIRDGHVTGVQTCALPIYELDSIDGEKIIKEGTNFKSTVIWNKLYPFQRDGVVGIIDKIEKHNGCILADSVGLGKTFSALAVIKYYELRNDRVLVLSPKKLRDNWTVYTQDRKSV